MCSFVTKKEVILAQQFGKEQTGLHSWTYGNSQQGFSFEPCDMRGLKCKMLGRKCISILVLRKIT
jgi:hypothetical protein